MREASGGGGARGQHPVLAFGVGSVAFLGGVGLLLVGSSETERSAEFVRSPGFVVWASAIAAQTAFWAVVALPLWQHLVRLWRRTRRGRAATVVLAMLLALIVVGLPLVSLARQFPWPLWGHQTKIRILTAIGGLFVGVPALTGMTLVHQWVRHRATGTIDKDDLLAALEAREELLRFLSVAGAMIGLAVLAAGALRKATVPTFVPESDFPQEAVLLYGAFFTGLLLLVYVPAHLAVKQLATAVRDGYFRLSEMPEPHADAFKPWIDKRGTLEDVLQLNVAPLQQLQASLFVLAPLLSGVITSLVPAVR